MIKAIVIGASAGGIDALSFLLPHIPDSSKVPVFVVQHINASSDSFFIRMMNDKCQVEVKEACHTEPIRAGVVYFAPPDYHLLIEDTKTIALSVDEKVNFSRPSIDVLFETAAFAFRKSLTGILLTGSNSDGGLGMLHIHNAGGYTIAQSPKDALMAEMPRSAIRLFTPNQVLTLKEIAAWLEANLR